MGEAMTDKVTVIIPARKEPYVRETLKDLFSNAQDEIEVILILDGWKPDYRIYKRKGLRIFRNAKVEGMRPSINKGVEAATGKYIMKMDAHCSIGPGWDAILKADCADNWIVVPRRYWFDAPNWKKKDKPTEYVDAMAYMYPFARPYKPRLTGRPCDRRMIQQADQMLVEDMTFQGSLWFMHKEHFTKRLGPMDWKSYGTFGEEPQEIGLKTQLGPWEGAIMRNKNTWYAHWSKPGIHWRTDPEIAGRVTDAERENSYVFAFDYWWNNRWEERKHDFLWMVEKFEPMDTWPENWRWLVTRYDRFKIEDLWHTQPQH
jgi:glycosyltransferase involved in cell wall biosynthesis